MAMPWVDTGDTNWKLSAVEEHNQMALAIFYIRAAQSGVQKTYIVTHECQVLHLLISLYTITLILNSLIKR